MPIRTDRAVYAEPAPLPTIPALGGVLVQPTFDATIIRATDASDSPAPGAGTFYNEWPTFNLNNTQIFYRKGTSGEGAFKTFNPDTYALGAAVNAPSNLGPFPGGPQWQGATWSTTNPDLIFTHPSYVDGGVKLLSYNVVSTTWTLIKDLSSVVGIAGDYFFEMHMATGGGSVTDDVFSFGMRRTSTLSISSISESGTTVTVNISTGHDFIVGDSIEITGVTNPGYDGFFAVASIIDSDSFTYTHTTSGLSSSSGGTVGPDNPIRYIIYKRSTDTVLLQIGSKDPRLFPQKGTNVCLPDKSGRWFFFSENNGATADQRRVAIWDAQTNTWQYMAWNISGDTPSHGDMGTGILAGRGAFSGNENVRNLSDVSVITSLLDWKVPVGTGTRDWSNDAHSSLYADDENWLMLSMYDDPSGGTGETGVWENEIMQVSLSDPISFKRLCHTYSRVTNVDADTNGYWAIPKGTISRNGEFIAFTSNWGDSGRTDLFILVVGESTSAPPPQSPRIKLIAISM